MSIASLSSDLDAILSHAGVAVVYGVQSTNGWLRNDEATLQPGSSGFELIESSQSVLIRDGSLTGLTEDSAITVNGVSYNIRDIGTLRTDGLRKLILVEVSP